MIPFDSVKECVVDVLDAEGDGIASDTPLAELRGWDSVNALRVLTSFERTFRVRLRLEAFSAARTVGELHRLVAEGTS